MEKCEWFKAVRPSFPPALVAHILKPPPVLPRLLLFAIPIFAEFEFFVKEAKKNLVLDSLNGVKFQQWQDKKLTILFIKS
jgi:hypothetical protein